MIVGAGARVTLKYLKFQLKLALAIARDRSTRASAILHMHAIYRFMINA